jgi:type VI protein secretion system component VasK
MLGDFLITVVWLFFWTMALMIFISVFSDIFRREDLSGGMKAVWIIVIFVLPFLGCLIYMIARPKMTAQDVRSIAQAEAASKAVAGVSTADELTKLTQLRDANVISPQQYEALKAKLLTDAGAAGAAATTPAAPAS